MTWPNIIGLGEVMNFPGVVANDAKMLGEIAATMKAGKTVGGHYASPDLGLPFHGLRRRRARRRPRRDARIRRDRPRAAGHAGDAAAGLGLVRRGGADQGGDRAGHRPAQLHPVHRRLPFRARWSTRATWTACVRHAIAQGLKPVTAIQMATLNTAQHFGLERELGSIAPGRRADFLLISDLTAMPIEPVFARGVLAAEAGKLAIDIPPYDYPDERAEHGACRPDDSRRPISTSRRPSGANEVRARVIGVVENQAPTKALEADLPVRGRSGRDGPRRTTSARSRWSSGTGAPARSSTPSSRASATRRTARSPRRSRMTATT